MFDLWRPADRLVAGSGGLIPENEVEYRSSAQGPQEGGEGELKAKSE